MIVYVIWSNIRHPAMEWNLANLDVPQTVICLDSCNRKDFFTANYSLQKYYHHSVNSKAYERKCFERFGGLLQYMKIQNIPKVMHLDSDIILKNRKYYDTMMSHETAFIRKADNYYGMTDASTYASVLSIEILTHFVKFMEYSFSDPKITHSIAIKYGVPVSRCCSYYKGHIQNHLSDMKLFMACLKNSKNYKNVFFVSPDMNTEKIHCLRCNNANASLLHFQGSCKKRLDKYIKTCL